MNGKVLYRKAPERIRHRLKANAALHLPNVRPGAFLYNGERVRPVNAEDELFTEWNRGHASVLEVWPLIFPEVQNNENHVCIQHAEPQKGTPGAR